MDRESKFRLDWHTIALPIVQEQSSSDPLFIFKQWLARVLILRPIPSRISGDSTEETLEPTPSVSDFGAWVSGVVAHAPAAYGVIKSYLKDVLPDLAEIRNPASGKDSRSLEVTFAHGQETLVLPFGELSDGEKCFLICALVLASNEAYGPLLCFWDEPDNHLAIDEVSHLVVALRRAFQSRGQFIATSHNPEAILRFSDENTFVLHRKNHLEPSVARLLETLKVEGDLMNALIRGDLQS